MESATISKEKDFVNSVKSEKRQTIGKSTDKLFEKRNEFEKTYAIYNLHSSKQKNLSDKTLRPYEKEVQAVYYKNEDQMSKQKGSCQKQSYEKHIQQIRIKMKVVLMLKEMQIRSEQIQKGIQINNLQNFVQFAIQKMRLSIFKLKKQEQFCKNSKLKFQQKQKHYLNQIQDLKLLNEDKQKVIALFRGKLKQSQSYNKTMLQKSNYQSNQLFNLNQDLQMIKKHEEQIRKIEKQEQIKRQSLAKQHEETIKLLTQKMSLFQLQKQCNEKQIQTFNNKISVLQNQNQSLFNQKQTKESLIINLESQIQMQKKQVEESKKKQKKCALDNSQLRKKILQLIQNSKIQRQLFQEKMLNQKKEYQNKIKQIEQFYSIKLEDIQKQLQETKTNLLKLEITKSSRGESIQKRQESPQLKNVSIHKMTERQCRKKGAKVPPVLNNQEPTKRMNFRFKY